MSGGTQDTLRSVSIMGGARRGATVAAMVLVAALSASVLVYVGYLWSTLRGINDIGDMHVTALRQPSVARTQQHATDPVFVGQNLLIVGNDDRSGMTDAEVRELKVGRDGGSLATDSMLLVHIPADGSRAVLVSLPRDSYVHIPGYGMNRLNAAYGFGYRDASGNLKAKRAAGAALIVRTVHQLTGVPIDHFVQVSLLGFVRISDAIGNVTINLCNDVDDTVAHNVAEGEGHVGSGFKMSKGIHHIHGIQALEFVRQRHNIPGSTIPDYSRAARQRYFLTAALRHVTDASMLLDLAKLQRLVDAVRSSVYADENLDVLDLARQLSELSANNISGHVVPTAYYWHDSPVGDVGIVHPAQVKRYVRNLLSPHKATPRKHHVRHQRAVNSGCIN